MSAALDVVGDCVEYIREELKNLPEDLESDMKGLLKNDFETHFATFTSDQVERDKRRDEAQVARDKARDEAQVKRDKARDDQLQLQLNTMKNAIVDEVMAALLTKLGGLLLNDPAAKYTPPAPTTVSTPTSTIASTPTSATAPTPASTPAPAAAASTNNV